MPCPVNTDRIVELNDRPIRDGDYVIYWVQQAQRAEINPALEYAVYRANQLDLPVIAVFGLTASYPEANLRHYRFMLQGLQDLEQGLRRRRIKLVVRPKEPDAAAIEMAENAALAVCDRGYLRFQKIWRQTVARQIKCRLIQVETDAIVPVKIASEKTEYAARTIRPKLHRQVSDFLVPLTPLEVEMGSLGLPIDGLELGDLGTLETGLNLRSKDSVAPVDQIFTGGTTAARDTFHNFLQFKFQRYAQNRNQPQTADVSHMSKYLHFGQISPVWLLLQANRHAQATEEENLTAFTEELLVRRELALNFVEYTDAYDRYDSLPEWARDTLDDHRHDERPHIYSCDELEAGATHDQYWNAAMSEMKDTGYMHNYMRMYWGKKILEWTGRPEDAFKRLLYLNNKYFIDGRDPVSYASVAWTFGRHDRPWPERPVFGKIRYMSAGGLERKCDIASYVTRHS